MAGFIGILSLDTAFPRIHGDAGNPESWRAPARVKVVEGAQSPDIVRDGRPSGALTRAFISAAQEFEAEGAGLIVSTCGFLITVQQDIAAAVRIPVLLSALSLAPLARALTGGRKIGVLTASRASLGEAALSAAGLRADEAVIYGMEDAPGFAETFLAPKSAQRRDYDPAAMAREAAARGRAMVAAHPDIGAIILECGNLPPFAGALRAAVKRPVITIFDGAEIFAPGLMAERS